MTARRARPRPRTPRGFLRSVLVRLFATQCVVVGGAAGCERIAVCMPLVCALTDVGGWVCPAGTWVARCVPQGRGWLGVSRRDVGGWVCPAGTWVAGCVPQGRLVVGSARRDVWWPGVHTGGCRVMLGRETRGFEECFAHHWATHAPQNGRHTQHAASTSVNRRTSQQSTPSHRASVGQASVRACANRSRACGHRCDAPITSEN
jgi:hypothetical protein